jgi:hypothetical protein
MMDKAEIAVATGRLRAASTELAGMYAAGEAFGRMAYLWAWSVRYGRVLSEWELDEAVREFWLDYPTGFMAEQRGVG